MSAKSDTVSEWFGLYDALSLEVDRAASLADHLEQRLETLAEDETTGELYSLSVVAHGIGSRLQLILEKAGQLHNRAVQLHNQAVASVNRPPKKIKAAKR